MKDNSMKAIIAIVLTIIILVIAIIFANRNTNTEEEQKDYSYETESFKNVNLKQTIELFKRDEATFLFIGRQGCEGAHFQAPYIIYAQVYYTFEVYHLDINDIDFENDPNVELLKEKLDYPYELEGKKGTFGSFLGTTPMVVIIKNKKQVYGNIGVLTDEEIVNILKEYGVKTYE